MLHDLGVSHVYRERLFLLRKVIVSVFAIQSKLFVNTHNEDNALSSAPTTEWQDRLAARLSRNTLEGPHNAGARQSPSHAFGGAPLPQRRRLDESSSGPDLTHPNWNEMYTMETLSGDLPILMVSKSIQPNAMYFRFSRDR